jgi:hypothetical protein
MWLAILASMKPKPKGQRQRIVGVVLKRVPRRLSSPAQRLQFVVQFAQMDLATLRPGDWLNLRDDLAAFLHGPWYGLDVTREPLPLDDALLVRPTAPPYPDTYPEEAFQQLQAETRTLLYDMVLGTRDRTSAPLRLLPLQVHLGAPSLDGLVPVSGQHALVAEGSTRDVFLLLVFMLLKQVGSKRIVRCPECGTIFYRHGNQDYCSRPCVNRVSQRLWRHRHDAASTES